MHIWKAASSPLLQHDIKTMTILKIKESEPNIWEQKNCDRSTSCKLIWRKGSFSKTESIQKKRSIRLYCVQLSRLYNVPRAWKGVGWKEGLETGVTIKKGNNERKWNLEKARFNFQFQDTTG